MIEYYNKKNEEDSVEKLSEFKKGCWVHVVNPTKEELLFLVDKLNLSEANLIDGVDIHENPRFEIENKMSYIYLTAPTKKIKLEHDSSFLVVYAKDFFLTLAKNNLEIFDTILNPKTNFNKFTKSRNLIKILYIVSRMYEKSVHKILKESKENRAELSQLRNKDIEKLINYEDKLNAYISSFGRTINTYNRILRDKSVKFIKKDEVIIEDLIIDLNETLELCKQTSKRISNMRNYYSTKLSNDLNKTVTVLTVMTIFLSIPTLISSIYGMNVPLPFQDSSRLLPMLLIIASSIGVFFFGLLRHKKML
jgi:magnesium transporter